MQLDEWIFKSKRSQRSIAKELGITEQYFSQIKVGAVVPGRKTAEAIETLTKGEVLACHLRHVPLTIKDKIKARLNSKFAI